MNLISHYNKLWEEAFEAFRKGEFQVDPLIHSRDDNRFGVTLLLRPTETVLSSIEAFQKEVLEAEPGLYYQPRSDIHITVLSIISCYDGFQLSDIDIKKQIDLIQKSIEGFSLFNIWFKGITASPSAIMLQGFPEGDHLNHIRNSLRLHYDGSNEPSRMDVRYAITTAHSTIIRFSEQPEHPDKFLSVLEKYREYDFGSFEVNSLEFVYNDWYQKNEKVKKLAEFRLTSF